MKVWRWCFLCLVGFSLSMGCMHYSKGNLDYLKSPMAPQQKGKMIEYRVNIQHYGLESKWEPDKHYPDKFLVDDNGKIFYTEEGKTEELKLEEREVVKSIIENFLKHNELRLKEVFNLKPEDVFLNISVVFHSTQTNDDSFCGISGYTFSATLAPMKWDEYNIYYAIDVYDKRVLNKVINTLMKDKADKTVWDAGGKKFQKVINLNNLVLDGLKPAGSYEYRRVIIQRIIPLACIFPVSIPLSMKKNKKNSLSDVIKDMNGEFLEDINKNQYNQVITHNLTRDGRPGLGGLYMNKEQIGENSSAIIMATLAAGGMVAASASQYSGKGFSLESSMKMMGRDLALEAVKAIAKEYLKSKTNIRLSDNKKNLYISFVKDNKTKKWLFRGAAKSLGDVPGAKEGVKDPTFKVVKKYFESPDQMNQWITKQEKWKGK